MTILAGLLQTPLVRAMGAALFHSLWEGIAGALLLAAVLALTRNARVRYGAACAASFALAIAFCATLALCLPEDGAQAGPVFAIAGIAAVTHSAPVFAESPVQLLRDAMQWFVPFWMLGLACFSLRNFAGWMAVQRLRARGVAVPGARLTELARRMGVTRATAMLASTLVDVPVTAGFLRPVILLPAGLIAAMPVEQLEYLLVHELAHIRRHDYLVNLFQKVVEALLFYHPAVWWISGILNAERENCCDDLVLEVCGNARDYAAALASLEDGRPGLTTALAASGGNLAQRIRRMLRRPGGKRANGGLLVPAMLLIAAGSFAFVDPAYGGDSALFQHLYWFYSHHFALQPTVQPASTYDKWLNEDVLYIIQKDERAAFEALHSDAERDRFIEQFWERRGTKAEHYRRIAYANSRFGDSLPGWKTDRGRIYITYGPPDEIDSHAGAAPPFEEWRYRHLQGIGDGVLVRFENRDGTYRMTKDPHAN